MHDQQFRGTGGVVSGRSEGGHGCMFPFVVGKFFPLTRVFVCFALLTTHDAEWYIISVVSVCLSDDNFRKP